MKKYLSIACILMFGFAAKSQTYQPNWPSLDQRPVPQWFKDAKFGIFIHWGVYAVPGYTSKGNYAEWYQNGLNNKNAAILSYHQKKFGDLSYYQLADQFKAELFEPDEWARLFEESGAKYIVLTSKHHDGFALWPSEQASRTWNFPWNAKETGPKRDLLGDLFAAVRKTSVRAGMYYSLYEWYNPLWKTDKNRYIAEHMWPQMQDVIKSYQPDVFWTDGDWDLPAETWKSQEFLAWLYNESPVKERVVVNDRWGAGIRFHHGGIYTPEYQPDLDFEDHYWEESRGMGFSYGYNRMEDSWDYNSTQSLILQLIDKVSRGGNFLLDIGPDEHGKIPPIMQERLLAIGDWLKQDGEAIYGSVRWKYPSQWSEGKKDYRPKNGSGDLLLKLTIDPEPGYAVKELFFTYNEKANALYALFPIYPSNSRLVLKSFNLPSGTSIELLGSHAPLSWKQEGENVSISLPAYDPNKMKAPYAFAVKISGYGSFAPSPAIKADYSNPQKPIVAIEARHQGDMIHYTTDGSNPNGQSAVYTKPFAVERTTAIRALAMPSSGLESNIVLDSAISYEWNQPLAAKNKPAPGLKYQYFELSNDLRPEHFDLLPIKDSGTTSQFTHTVKKRTEKFRLLFTGTIRIEKDGLYTFYTDSDDGSRLMIDHKTVVDNYTGNKNAEKGGSVALKKGFHHIQVDFYDSGGANHLKVFVKGPDGQKLEIPASLLYQPAG